MQVQPSGRVAVANVHLLKRFSSADELKQSPPDAATLIRRVVSAAASAQPTAGVDDVRCALALVAVDRADVEMREVNLIEVARRRGMSWRDIAWSLGLDSAQAAQKRFQKLTQEPEILVYAFRVAGDKAWHGKPDLLPNGRYEVGRLDFNPARPSSFRGSLELRYGPVDEECPPAPMRVYALVNTRRVPLTTAVQDELFGG